MISRSILLAFVVVSALSGCAATPPASKTPLEIQAFQTKEFQAEKTIVFGAVLSVFQDLGYIVQSADRDTGFITAASPAGNKTNFWDALGGMSASGQTKATAFVEQIRPAFCTVRLNFVDTKRLSTLYGQTQDQDKPILDPKPYQIAFEKIDSAVFVRSGSLSTPPAPAQPSSGIPTTSP